MTLKSILGAATALGLALAAPAFAQDPTKVGFIYVGPIGDHGWSYTHDQGRLAVEAEFGDAVEPPMSKPWPKAPTPNVS